MNFSAFGGDSPPRAARLPSYPFIQRNLPVVIEQNVSYTRSDQQAGKGERADLRRHTITQNNLSADLEHDEGHSGRSRERHADNHRRQPLNTSTDGESDEDAHFLRLAHDALVATSKESNLMVDPTIQDLLRRLQYALSPHGNPIKRLENIRTNANGQLMIQNFYNVFPNLSNDIFTSSQGLVGPDGLNGADSPARSDNSDWNFLLNKLPSDNVSPEPSDGALDPSGLHRRQDRKFPCTSCSMSFRRSLDLKRHEKQHLTIPANICPQCGKGFARKDALKRHLGTLTCKRNAEKKLYHKNLQYLKENGWDGQAQMPGVDE